MANQEHVNILNQGVAAWNQWREKNPAIIPELKGADLRGRLLSNINFRQANLSAANFSEPPALRERNIGGNAYTAFLGGADLSGADLSGSDLSDADLREADLREANLHSANLHGADFRGSIMRRTELGNVDLSAVKGLAMIRHHGPSTVGIDTIYRSGGKIPELFLRGAGVPETFITYMHSSPGAVADFYSCFISYSSRDHEFAERLHGDLQKNGVRCWFAPEDLKIGDKLRPAFDEAIHLHDKLLVILSESSVQSSWVENEVETAFEKERKQTRIVLFPIRVDDTVMGTDQAWAVEIRRTRHIGDFRGWKNQDSFKKAFARLLRDLSNTDKR